MTFRTGQAVYNRFTRETLTVISCDGCVAMVRDQFGGIGGSIVGDLTSLFPTEVEPRTAAGSLD